MKVLHLINTLSAGGAEMHLLTLTRQLKRHGINVMVACLREQVKGSRSLRSEFEKEQVPVRHLNADSRYNWRFLAPFLRLLDDEQPDILHTHLPRADLAGAYGKFYRPATVWVSSVHDIYSKSWSGRWAMPLLNLIWRQADRVVAISDAVKQWLVNDRGVLPDKVKVVYYGIEPERFSRATVNLRDTWSLNGAGIVGSIGRLEPRKAHDCLVKAMAALGKRATDTRLLIAGHDPWGHAKRLESLIHDLELDHRVTLVGFQDDVGSFLGALDVFALASVSEGFGQVVIEAMAAGKPVVASNIPPLTEIVIDGKTGLLVAPGDSKAFAQAISWLLDRPDKARQMGIRGQQRVQSHFSANNMAQEILSLYALIVGGHHVQRSLG